MDWAYGRNRVRTGQWEKASGVPFLGNVINSFFGALGLYKNLGLCSFCSQSV